MQTLADYCGGGAYCIRPLRAGVQRLVYLRCPRLFFAWCGIEPIHILYRVGIPCWRHRSSVCGESSSETRSPRRSFGVSCNGRIWFVPVFILEPYLSVLRIWSCGWLRNRFFDAPCYSYLDKSLVFATCRLVYGHLLCHVRSWGERFGAWSVA